MMAFVLMVGSTGMYPLDGALKPLVSGGQFLAHGLQQFEQDDLDAAGDAPPVEVGAYAGYIFDPSKFEYGFG